MPGLCLTFKTHRMVARPVCFYGNLTKWRYVEWPEICFSSVKRRAKSSNLTELLVRDWMKILLFIIKHFHLWILDKNNLFMSFYGEERWRGGLVKLGRLEDYCSYCLLVFCKFTKLFEGISTSTYQVQWNFHLVLKV